MAAIFARALAFAHPGERPLWAPASFSLSSSDGPVGLVGANGAGKSTLLRVLAGELAPTSGSSRVDPDRGRVRLLSSVLDARAASPGEIQRRRVAEAFAERPDALLLDEPTAHVDAVFRAEFARLLARFRGLVVIATHDRELLALTRSTLWIGRDAVRFFPQPYVVARDQLALEARTAAALRDDHRREERRLARSLDQARREHEAADRGRSSRARMKNARDHDANSGLSKFFARRAEAKAGRGHVRAEEHLARHREHAPPPGEHERGRSLVFAAERPPLAIVAFANGVTIARDERVRIAGPNGAGKTTLLEALVAGLRLPRDRALAVPQVVGAETISIARRAIDERSPAERDHVWSILAALGASPATLRTTPSPSSGEARKLLLALGLAARVSAVFLDEPTNHLDLPSIERLEAALAGYAGTLVLVTHDEALAARLTTRTIDLGNSAERALSRSG